MAATVTASLALSEVDEALMHLSLTPVNERGEAWHRYLDERLEERHRLVPVAERGPLWDAMQDALLEQRQRMETS